MADLRARDCNPDTTVLDERRDGTWRLCPVQRLEFKCK